MRPGATAPMSAKNGRLSMFSPGKGIGWILSIGATNGPGIVVRSSSRVLPLAEAYSGLSLSLIHS